MHTNAAPARPGRTKGSCRFADYFKVQTWNPDALSWLDIQKSHATETEARDAAPRASRARVVTVTEKGRTMGEPFDA